jgi:2-hydroxychromene-2-carboxylate isomerase
MSVAVTHYSDPGCPWAYSASPAHTVLRWRYGSQLQWRLVTIGLTERADQYVKRGYTPAKSARGYLKFRRYGMPFATEPRPRVAGTGTACRAIVATRLRDPQREDAVFRALQFGWFTTPLVLDEAADLEIALRRVEGLDVRAILASLHAPEVESAYESDRAEARSAEGGPTHFQGKAANTDGQVRFTAPSVVFESNGSRLEAGGFQSIEAYDVLIANLDPTLTRSGPPEDLIELLAAFPEGLVTQEVAAILAPGNEPPDRRAAEEALIDLVAAGDASRIALGDDALWMPARAARRLVRVA